MNDVLALIQGSKSSGCVDEKVRDAALAILRQQAENKTCFDCSKLSPPWLSLTLGVWICFECSGEHRSFGVHLSFVRSATLDGFTAKQIVQMAVGGNARAKEFFRNLGITGKRKDAGAEGRKIDYKSTHAAKYRDLLAADVKRILEENLLTPAQEAEQSCPTTAPTAKPEPTPAPTPAKASIPSELTPFADPWPQKPAVTVPTALKVTPSAPQAKFGFTSQPVQSNLRATPLKAKSLDADFDFDQFED